MRERAAFAVWDLIERYELHGTPDAPADRVNLEPLENLFPLALRDLSGLGIDGFVIPPMEGVSDDSPAVVTVNRRLSDWHRRLVYAHEIGHALHGHEGAFRLDQMDAWYVDREEREAWKVAARLLVPMDAIVRYGEVQRIAAACHVPVWLVELAL